MSEPKVKIHLVNGSVGFTVASDDIDEATKLADTLEAKYNKVTPQDVMDIDTAVENRDNAFKYVDNAVQNPTEKKKINWKKCNCGKFYDGDKYEKCYTCSQSQ